ncbi:hypothetical protein [Bradyrhizobium sp. WBAH23]|uniref:hypothetical protein n=1 Tax=Bradyrhizobium sp. WBAH23 TaxID=1390119 RepID=UPI001586B166|nr:hypothetical protein [Bradyrhizobium sp. WBAH23]
MTDIRTLPALARESRKVSAMRARRVLVIAAYAMAVPATAGLLAQIMVTARTC